MVVSKSQDGSTYAVAVQVQAERHGSNRVLLSGQERRKTPKTFVINGEVIGYIKHVYKDIVARGK